jgi:hypothetical protein
MCLITLISRTKNKYHVQFEIQGNHVLVNCFSNWTGYLFDYSAHKCNPIHYPVKLIKMMPGKYIEEQYICFISCPMQTCCCTSGDCSLHLAYRSGGYDLPMQCNVHWMAACRLPTALHICLWPRSLPTGTQNISSSTHHIKSLNACMKH